MLFLFQFYFCSPNSFMSFDGHFHPRVVPGLSFCSSNFIMSFNRRLHPLSIFRLSSVAILIVTIFSDFLCILLGFSSCSHHQRVIFHLYLVLAIFFWKWVGLSEPHCLPFAAPLLPTLHLATTAIVRLNGVERSVTTWKNPERASSSDWSLY